MPDDLIEAVARKLIEARDKAWRGHRPPTREQARLVLAWMREVAALVASDEQKLCSFGACERCHGPEDDPLPICHPCRRPAAVERVVRGWD